MCDCCFNAAAATAVEHAKKRLSEIVTVQGYGKGNYWVNMDTLQANRKELISILILLDRIE